MGTTEQRASSDQESNQGKTFEKFVQQLTDLGYEVQIHGNWWQLITVHQPCERDFS